MLTQRKVTIIQPTNPGIKFSEDGLQTKKRVGAYARVSTDSEDQLNSYQAQIKEYTERIKANPKWIFKGLYADEGLSGTSTKKRFQFLQMLQDARDGHLDLILTKSISRFARNTVDSLTIIRELRHLGVEVYFEKENLYSSDSKIDFMLTIFSSIAQEESRNISENVKWGFRKRFKEGVVHINTKRFLGYDKDEFGKIIIHEEEANTVRMIFNLYLAGYSVNEISKHLMENKMVNGRGEVKWQPYTINYLLTNEKYCGDAILQKRVTIDYLSHKTVVNTGQAPQYRISGNHPAIISKEIFEMVQTLKQERGSQKASNRHAHRFLLSGLVYCGQCHRKMYRTHYNPETSYARIVMSCKNNPQAKCQCSNTPIDNELLEKLSAHVMKQLGHSKPHLIDEVVSILKPHLSLQEVEDEFEKTQTNIENLESELQALIKLRISNATKADDGYYQQVFETKKAELQGYLKKKQELESKRLDQYVNEKRMMAIKDHLDEKCTLLDRQSLTAFIKIIVVHSPSQVTLVLAKRDIDEKELMSVWSQIDKLLPILDGHFTYGQWSTSWQLVEWR